jgi:hypothetical protein
MHAVGLNEELHVHAPPPLLSPVLCVGYAYVRSTGALRSSLRLPSSSVPGVRQDRGRIVSSLRESLIVAPFLGDGYLPTSLGEEEMQREAGSIEQSCRLTSATRAYMVQWASLEHFNDARPRVFLLLFPLLQRECD